MKNFESSFTEHRVAKLGTNVLVDGTNINEQVQFNIAIEIIEQRMRGIWTGVITSGAVALGKDEFNGHSTNSADTAVRLFSTIGQKKLMRSWEDAYIRAAKHLGIGRRIHTSEGILTRHNFSNSHAVTKLLDVVKQAQNFESAGNDLIFFIENGNDLIADEHIHNDNDGLASDFARAIHAQVLYLLSNVDGFYDGDPQLTHSQLISEVSIDTSVAVEELPEFAYISAEISKNGRGGAVTKLRAIHEYVSQITNGVAYIGQGTVEKILQLLDEREQGTQFKRK